MGLLRDDGFLIVTEITSDFEIAFVNEGLFEGEFGFDDNNRKYGAYFTHEQLMDVFKECGLNVCNYQV